MMYLYLLLRATLSVSGHAYAANECRYEYDTGGEGTPAT